MTAPSLIAKDIFFSIGNPNPFVVSWGRTVQPGDIVFVVTATDAGPFCTGVTAAGLTFLPFAQMFSMAIFYAVATTTATIPSFSCAMTSNAYEDNAAMVIQARAPLGFTLAFDTNMSLPAVTGGGTPATAVYSTDFADDLVLFFIGATVGKFGFEPWSIPPPNTVGNGFSWQNGISNTTGFSEVSLCLYAKLPGVPLINDTAMSTAVTTGGVYIVTALTVDTTVPALVESAAAFDTVDAVFPVQSGMLLEQAVSVDRIDGKVIAPAVPPRRPVTAFKVPLIATPQLLTTPIGKLKRNITVHWCAPANCWILDIADTNNVPLLSGIPLITGANLLEQYGYQDWEVALIVQTSDDADAVPTGINLGTTGNLYVVF